MTISFNEIPANIRVPGAYIEIDSSRASTNLQQDSRILVIGQRLTTGETLEGVPVKISSYPQAVRAFGQGSMLANMFEILFRNNAYTEKWAVALDDNGAGVAAVGQISLDGSSATAAGTISLYIGGILVQVGVAAGDTDAMIAIAVAAAINANTSLPVIAAVINDAEDNLVSITYRHKGLVGNSYNISLNQRGAFAGEVLPAGVTVTLTQVGTTTAGTGDPSIATAIAALPDEIFDYWLVPYTSSTALDALDEELNSRWHPLRMKEGHVFTAAKGTAGTLTTLGESRNNQHITIMDAGNGSPTPPYLWAAATVGRVAYAATIDPARPFNTLPLTGILPEPAENRRSLEENNSMLYDGIATHTTTKVGLVQIQRVVTTYRQNAFEVNDAAYLDANTMFTLSYYRQTLRARITTKFPRHKLADDGTRFGAGQAIVTPKIIKAEIVALAKQWEEKGLIEDVDTFKKEMIVERDLDDRNRVNAMLPTNLVNQFHIFAAQISFIV